MNYKVNVVAFLTSAKWFHVFKLKAVLALIIPPDADATSKVLLLLPVEIRKELATA